ncbi:MAG: class I SAM-dependent methyltransferase [Thermoplasmatota archaeon]
MEYLNQSKDSHPNIDIWFYTDIVICGNMNGYKETEQFWNDVFSEEKNGRDLNQSLSVEDIEEGIKWLSEGSGSIIDFGCGNGVVLLRAGYLCDSDLVGVDISEKAVDSAEEIAEYNGLDDRSKFIRGGVSKLSQFEENEFDAGILSNIVDNLLPEDARKLLSEYHRIIQPDGRILLKLNDYIDPEQLEEWGSEKIYDDFYKEETGLYFWNLADKDVDDLLSEYFIIEKKIDVEFKEHDQVNRMYYLKNKD